MDLRCRKTTCKYNKDLTCKAKSIDISKERSCCTFQKDEQKQKQDFSQKIFSDQPPKVADYRHLGDMHLNCCALCLFNRDGHCISNGITVNSATTKEPKCITFMKP